LNFTAIIGAIPCYPQLSMPRKNRSVDRKWRETCRAAGGKPWGRAPPGSMGSGRFFLAPWLRDYLVAHPTNRKWVITPVKSGLTLLIPFISGVITHLLSGMSHQVDDQLLFQVIHKFNVNNWSHSFFDQLSMTRFETFCPACWGTG
jgi:hypothetical protein